jgi:hypothetical protein
MDCVLEAEADDPNRSSCDFTPQLGQSIVSRAALMVGMVAT